MSNAALVKEIVGTIKGLDLAHHPLPMKIKNGQLTEAQVKGWAKQWYHGFLKDADRWIGQAFVNCEDPDLRESLAKNVGEEALGTDSGTAGHPVLYNRFIKGLGISDEELENEPLTPEASASLYNFWSIRNIPWYQFGALFVTSEGAVPRAYVPIMEGLNEHYGVAKEDLIFFEIHAGEVDVEHTATNLNVIRDFVISDRDCDECRGIVNRTAGHIVDLLNVYEKY